MQGDMHEFSITQRIPESTLIEAEKNNGRRISVLGVKLGKTRRVKPDSLELRLRAVRRGTVAKKARMEIKRLELTVGRSECGHTFSVQKNELFCPSCGIDSGVTICVAMPYTVLKGREKS